MANYKLPTKGQVTARTNSNREKYASTLSKEENDIRLKQNASFIGSSNDPFSTPGRDNYQTYPYDYYAGSDCKIFFGDIWVDDIITIQYNSTQSKTPIYGYASQNFDAIARGQILVEGNLAIAFKETGYLNIIQATLESQRVDASQLIQGKIKKIQDNDQQKFVPGLTTINDDSKEKLDFSYSANGTPQIIRQAQTIEQILTSKKSTEVLNTKFGGTSASDFEDFAEILEDSIWGDSNGKTLELENKLKRVDEFDYTGTGGILTAKGHNYSDVLNIMLTFGDINDSRAEHTMIVLNDVHFTSTSMIVSPNGDPIGEMYTFIARDINKSINTTANIYNINPIKLNIGNGAKLSKLEDINSIEQFLNKSGTDIASIKVIAMFDGQSWVSTTRPKSINFEFSPNKIEPFVDQLIKVVETNYNSFNLENQSIVFVSEQQVIVDVTIGTNKITMILEQVIPNTRTYKVISPTRTGFSLNNIITRDDIFSTKLESMKPPTQEQLNKKEQEAFSDFAEKEFALQEAEKLKEEQELKNSTTKEAIPKEEVKSSVTTPDPLAPVAETIKMTKIAETTKSAADKFVGPIAPKTLPQEQAVKETNTSPLNFQNIVNEIKPVSTTVEKNEYTYQPNMGNQGPQQPSQSEQSIQETSKTKAKVTVESKTTPTTMTKQEVVNKIAKVIPTSISSSQSIALSTAQGGVTVWGPTRAGAIAVLKGAVADETKKTYSSYIKPVIKTTPYIQGLPTETQNQYILEGFNQAAKGTEGERRLTNILNTAKVPKSALDTVVIRAVREVNKPAN